MSCGKPHETDCSQVLAEVWLLLDRECDEVHRLKLVEHLDECGPCLERYGLEEHLKLLLARKCGGEHVSEGFKQRLRDSIRQVMLKQAETTPERTAEDARDVEETRQTQVEPHRDPS